jgi:NAD(P)-dependent dehydrogenase (short-subunit alcohol dehydrogenase family)
MELELAGKTVVITGGTDGLGLALASQLASEGAAVAVCGRDEERLHAAEAALQAAGGDVLAWRADVSQAADLEAFVAAAVARWGRIDGIVHNAGRASGGAIETIDDSTWESDFQLKLMAAVRLTRLALPQLTGQSGRRPVHLGRLRQGARRVERAELGHPRRRHGAHEGALQGAGPRRHPRQRHPDRSH